MNFLNDILKDKAEGKEHEEAKVFLLPGERIIKLYRLIEDYVALTDKRILLVNNKLLSSKKGITSIPYSKITTVSLAKGGFMNFSKEIEITVGTSKFDFKLYQEANVMECFHLINEKILI